MFSKGSQLSGQKFTYTLVECLHTNKTVQSTLWKAKILESPNYRRPAQWAIIKTAPAEKQKWLNREHEAYWVSSISNSPHIRALYDEINTYIKQSGFIGTPDAYTTAVQEKPYCLVLEHLDTTLSDLDPAVYGKNLTFMAALFKGLLNGIKAIGDSRNIWTDGKPGNVLCSNVDGPEPVVKLSDLGLCQPDGYSKVALQSPALRAPEVWAGYGCWHVSDVYSAGSTVLAWLKPDVLGPGGAKSPLPWEAWCIAKMVRLLETDQDQTLDPGEETDPLTQSMYRLGRLLLTQPDDGTPESMHIPAQTLTEVLETLDTVPQVKALLPILLAPNFRKRKSAKEVLSTDEYKALQRQK